jgi:hypothetical protein
MKVVHTQQQLLHQKPCSDQSALLTKTFWCSRNVILLC